MSTIPRTQAAFIQGNQITIEHEASTSALVYLFQEVSKIASPIHNSFLDINSPSMSVQKEESAATSTQQWRTKTQRKQLNPKRSANIQDPDFQGVTFRIATELDDNREQSRLLITSKYSKELRKSEKKRRLRTRSQISLKTSSSDESSWMSSGSKGKVCASCCTRKTPMWRDAEDGTPLCNACGIRYKKYRVRCVYCWHIPRKEGNSNSCCLKCGNFVRLTTAQRKQST
ncbi:hypothetical protein PBY51_020202 [Eleginops maclovinus]|uniref:GATA-type domain-containing protein n=1 Tax=Eleginops maclovinus TaxID=56733 RepID=A0AAN7XSA3_ELEMC|nr:hypothetical protein PBY51_020202 [Eleginops maclovinus]